MKKDNILIYFFKIIVNPSENLVNVIGYTQLIILARWSLLGTLVTNSGAMVKGIMMPAKLKFPIKLRI